MSSILVPDCYQYIVGLSRTNCECYDIPFDASESLSGLYIDELESLSSIQSITNCENGGDIWEQMERSRQIAVTTFQADTNALIMKGFKLRRQNYSGGIGRAITKSTLNQIAGQWYGVRFYCANVKSGYMTIKNIGTIFADTGTKDVQVWNNLGELITTVNVHTTTNVHQKNVVSITLPLHSDYVENLEYYFIYQGDANMAKSNDLKCACGGFKPVFDTKKSYLDHMQQDRNYMWSNWVMVGGYHTPTLPDFSSYWLPQVTSNTMYGLTFEVDLKCKVNEVLCYESLDFESNSLAGAMAIAIQHKAASVLGSWIVNSGNLNRLNMINTEQLLNDIQNWNKIYIDMITYISEEVDITVNDCLSCKDIFEMAKRGILA